jgi:hypothetical protein
MLANDIQDAEAHGHLNHTVEDACNSQKMSRANLLLLAGAGGLQLECSWHTAGINSSQHMMRRVI